MFDRLRQWWSKRSATATSTLYQPSPWLYEALHAEPTFAGVPVDAQSSLHSTTVYACVRVLAESVAALPLILYKKDGDRTRQAIEHPLYSILNFRPNRLQSSYEFRSLLMAWLCLHGNAYVEIVRSKGEVTALWPMRPDRMIIRMLPTGELDYVFAQPGGPTYHLDPDSILHVKALSTDGLIGYSPIMAAKQAIGLDLVMGRFASTYFGSGARLGGVLTSPETLGDEGIRNIRESFKKMYTSPSQWHELLILEEGLKYEQFKVTSEEAQVLESRRYSVEDIARIFRVPPHMVGSLDKSNYSNIESLSREFIQNTLTPWLVNFESSYKLKLLKPSEWDSYYVSHDLTQTMRGDHETRMKGYQAGIQMGVYSPNDVRRMEQLDPREGGDIYLQPVNLAPSPWSPTQPQEKKE
jgi:HK97 family phage portal protein